MKTFNVSQRGVYVVYVSKGIKGLSAVCGGIVHFGASRFVRLQRGGGRGEIPPDSNEQPADSAPQNIPSGDDGSSDGGDVVVPAADLSSDDSVDIQTVRLVLPKSAEYLASTVTLKSFTQTAADFSRVGGAVMAESSSGQTALLGYRIAGETGETEVSLEATAVSLILMISGSSLTPVEKQQMVVDIKAHPDFSALVNSFEAAFTADPFFLETIRGNTALASRVRTIAQDLAPVDASRSAARTAANVTGVTPAASDRWGEDWVWYLYGGYGITDPPFMATTSVGQRSALGNPTMVNYVASLYDRYGTEVDWLVTPRNSTLVQKYFINGQAAHRELTYNRDISSEVEHLVFERSAGIQMLNLLHFFAGVVGVVSDAGAFNLLASSIENGKNIATIANCGLSLFNTVDFASTSTGDFVKNLFTGQVFSVMETSLTSCVIPAVAGFVSESADDLILSVTKSLGKVTAKVSNPIGWALMVFDFANDLGPFVVSWSASDDYIGYDLVWAGSTLVDVVQNDRQPNAVRCTDADADGYSIEGGSCGTLDCNDNSAWVFPGAFEICGDGIDQDCLNGDLACPVDPATVDDDGDGYSENQGDCNDSRSSIYPRAMDICGDGIDQDCYGGDRACPLNTRDIDDDGDGYSENQGDCDDTKAGVFPGAREICGDDIDQDCYAGDELCYVDPSDVDNDGDGYTENQRDCNDNKNSIYPGAAEICGDDIDQDCYDGDLECWNPGVTDYDLDGFSPSSGDCNDYDATIYPGATEICGDGTDQDCDGADESCVDLTTPASVAYSSSSFDLKNSQGTVICSGSVSTNSSPYWPDNNYIIGDAQLGDVDGDGLVEMVTIARHSPYYPAQVAVFNQNCILKGRYWNPGHLNSLLLKNIAGNSAPEIIVGGTNNDYRWGVNAPVIFALSGANVSGEAPPDYGSFPVGTELWYRVVNSSSSATIQNLSSPSGAVIGNTQADGSGTDYCVDYAGQSISCP